VKTARDRCGSALNYALLLLLVVPLVSRDCEASQNVKVGVVESRHMKAYDPARVGFADAMRSRGYNVQFLEYTLGTNPASASGLAAFVAQSDPGILLALGTDAAKAVKDANLTVPSIFSMVSEPGQSGLLNDGAYGGTPMTGACLDVPVEEQFSSLLAVVPKVQRIGVIYCPEESQFLVDEATSAANRMNVGLVTYPIHSEADVSNALSALRPKIDALWLVSDRIVLTTQSLQYVFLFAFQTNLPLMGLSDHFVKMGALFAVGPDYEDVGRQSGEIAAQLLDGRDASELPVAAPRKVLLSLNLRTAEIIGLRIPEGVVKKANSVY
jgi:putative ABC transport system substrate-binding protein